jgi:hypothetical protein
MELACFGFLIGAVVTMAVFCAGVVYADNKRKSDGDSDNDNRILERNRDRSDDQRDNQPVESEMIMVLDYFRHGATRYEKEIIDAIEERITQ